ncbi:MAG: hypothetical protein VXZ40_04230 [Nanoarchaeota archaeon]|nr:hypothetical protein [Nanoarchaeota archaeon]
MSKKTIKIKEDTHRELRMYVARNNLETLEMGISKLLSEVGN